MITLLTDFGLQDVYVGVMKGVIKQIYPDSQIIDLTHQIPPQDIASGRFALLNAYPYFPPGTVHIVVVDPGVGSRRRGIALQVSQGFFVGPDNGVLSGVIEQESVINAVELTNPDYWRDSQPSSTFHGRDIFAPVGAHLDRGVPITELGDPISPESLTLFPLPSYQISRHTIEGTIQHIDHFGNLITNIPSFLVFGVSWRVLIFDPSQSKSSQSRVIPSGNTYADAAPGHLIALIGSHGWVEIASNGDNAHSQLQLNRGAKLKVCITRH